MIRLTSQELAAGRRAMAEARPRIEKLKIEDEELEAYLLRIVTRLEALIDHPPMGSGARILRRALEVFLPILELDWVPAEPRYLSELPAEDQARIEKLRQERRLMAFQNSSVPPGDDRYKLALIDLLVESLAIFILYSHRKAEHRCLAMLMDLLEKETPTKSVPAAKVWVS